ncbi:FAD/NAD(P)-binding domain-containing protein [Mycena belliarum]|uniref:FAD/NAD(P)-binding domain-containing protein n=1 Tax=Mycena belliarum TaxID=1033014 RepID=A0AAD6UG61_9AGAR|nr:FAD/NAD(P)-binding domain-containing protein [Mycena belliae]
MSAFASESSTKPLKVAIVGGGIAGLTAAAALRLEGHEIHVFEASPTNTELGAAVSLSANALRALNHIGFDLKQLRGCDMLGSYVSLALLGGEGRFNAWYDPLNTFGHYGLLCHRSDLHEELKRLATAEDRPGRPATIHLKAGWFTTRTSSSAQTESTHSAMRTSVLGYKQTAPPSGRAAFRCLLDLSKIDGCTEFDWIHAGPAGIRGVRPQNARGRSLVVYTCRDKTLLNIVASFPDLRDQDACSWKERATKEQLVAAFADFGPQFTKLLSLVDGPVHLWQIRSLPVIPVWVRGRTALIGDAAHATFPTLGQGSAMGIEDAVTVACLLPDGTPAALVPRSLAAYETLRKPRGEFVLTESVEQVTVPEKRGLYGRSREMQAYIAGHDAVKVARDYFETHLTGASESEGSCGTL